MLIAESLRRNTHAKRHAISPIKQQPPSSPLRGAGGAAAASADEDGSDDGAWNVKGTKAAKKEAQRRKRRGQHKLRDGGEGARAGSPGQQGHLARGARGARRLGEQVEEEEEEGKGEEEEEEQEEEEEEAALKEGMEMLTLEGRLRSLEGSFSKAATTPASSGPATGAASQSRPPPACGSASGGAAGAAAAASAVLSEAAPVVVGLVGEPNVGKSSTLNALLGSHRVAVSSHPGRTKHYQTHYASRRLVLCDCPGLVFPRLDVSLPMQVGGESVALVSGMRRLSFAACVAIDCEMPCMPPQCGVLMGLY